MSIRSQRYIINPPSARPPHLRGIGGQVPLDLDDVARCAWGEILQTAPRSTSLFAFLEDLLEPGTDLVWRGQGPGRGTEMRRSFSSLFGRFFARAYLQVHHGFVWFAAIDGDNFHLSPSWRVSKKSGSRSEMPDWICARSGALAIGEAKGSHQKGNATRGGKPGPIRTAEGQITGVLVQKRQTAGRRVRWLDKSVKGWAVMSRWGLAASARPPFLYALDPKTDGENLAPEEIDELVQAVARTHVEQTALGLGLLKPIDDAVVPAPRRRIRIENDQKKRFFSGAVITPFGALNVGLDQARELAALLPNPELVRFVGLEEKILTDFLQGQPLVERQWQQIGDRSFVGSDGLVISPVDQITDLGDVADQA